MAKAVKEKILVGGFVSNGIDEIPQDEAPKKEKPKKDASHSDSEKHSHKKFDKFKRGNN